MPTHPIAFHFPNEEALRIALTSGLVPAQVQTSAAGVVRFHDGALEVVPSVAMPEPAATSLRSAGVKLEPVHSAGSPVSCWAQALAPKWVGEPEQTPGLMLCAVPRGESALELAAELLRLGCDRQELRFTGDDPETAAWLRVVQPPYYSVARILDRSSGVRGFVPSPAGQDRVWTQLGYSHPLAHAAKPGLRELVLIGGDGAWLRLADEGWTDLYQLIDLAVPGVAIGHVDSPANQRLSVPLRLARAPRSVPPSFWVLRTDAAREVDALVQNLPEETINRLLFAASADVVVLRARAGVDAPPELILNAESYIPFAGFQNLFIPGDTAVEPPLRRDRLRELLAPDPDRLFWLAPREGSAFRVESIAQKGFTPLADWVDYVVHSHAAALEPWVQSAVFEFERFESIGGEWNTMPPPVDEPEPDKPGKASRKARRESEDSEPPPVARSRATKASATPPPQQIPLTAASPSADSQKLARIERAFLASTAPADDASRQDDWLEMAQIHTRLNRSREAGLSWTRAIWEVKSSESGPWLRGWTESEAHLIGAKPTEVLSRTTPSRDETRALAAYITWALQDSDAASSVDTAQVQSWLDQHDQNLDVRSLWLCRAALARHVGGDRLGLTRVHDRVLARLQRGLSLERDVPTFLRFSSRGATDLFGAGQLVAGLDALLRKYETTKRKRHAVEAPVELTNAYVMFVFAYGLARLGQGDRARTLRLQATHALEKKDRVHQFLARAYGTRIEQALEGLPPETPLPAALEAELSAFDKDSRYAIDQLRRFSAVLESHESIDPVTAYHRNEGDARGAEFAGLRGLADAQRLGAEIDRITQLATAATGNERRRLFDGILDFLPALPESRAVSELQFLSRALEPFDPRARAAVAEKLLLMAGYFAAADVGRALAEELIALVPKLAPEGITEMGALMGRCQRSLRRLGLRETAATLLHALMERVEGDGPAVLASRVSLAGGLASLGRTELALPAFDAALTAIRREIKETKDVVTRCALVRAYCVAASQTNPAFALARIPPAADRLVDITEFMTAKYFCPPVVSFMESLVLGLASEDLELGESGRRWLDEDEYLVRRRVHRELREQA